MMPPSQFAAHGVFIAVGDELFHIVAVCAVEIDTSVCTHNCAVDDIGAVVGRADSKRAFGVACARLVFRIKHANVAHAAAAARGL